MTNHPNRGRSTAKAIARRPASTLTTPGEPMAPIDAPELAALVKAWRDHAGLTISSAARSLGIPQRTLEGIEQGRGIGKRNGYARLLMLALRAG